MKQCLLAVRWTVFGATMALMGACASTGPAPVEDLSVGARAHATQAQAPSRPAGQSARYRVQRGDTLYSIAFRNGVDYRELASWNSIRAPYTIYAGQELRLASTSPGAGRTPTRTAIVTAAAPARGPVVAKSPAPTPFENVAPATATGTTPVAAAESAPAATVPASTVSPAATVAPAAVATAPPPKSEARPPAASEQAAAVVGDIAWRWPADGTVVVTYVAGDRTRQGIDIAGKAGDPVRAAAAGTVVYSGNGLIGYGELIIVKHSPAFLSAYGHNRKRLVKEGDRVSAGQTIAEMGSSSASRDALHFEIRKNGKPVNPVDYLPRR